MSKQAKLTKLKLPVSCDIHLPSSKSESNRALIIQALADEEIVLHNISEARDTQTMQKLLASPEPELDVLDAGTTMRFLIAFCSVKKIGKIIEGTKRMHERPVKILVDALRELGSSINYLKKEGFPPVHVRGFLNGQDKAHVQVRGDVSSQYISALLMIAPVLEKGLTLELTGKIGSRPYIEMTLALMQHFGINYHWEDNRIRIAHQPYHSAEYTIESDWSGASYWYSLVALAKEAKVKLLGLRKNSFQGDIVIAEIMNQLGVASDFQEDGVLLTKKEAVSAFAFDFSHCPDLAQTVAVVCAAKGIYCTMRGLESLRIKETDRIHALQQELAKIGAKLREEDQHWVLLPAKVDSQPQTPVFDTYEDHRMAMALAPLVTQMDLVIKDPDVVKKSYPNYWKDLQSIGIDVSIT